MDLCWNRRALNSNPLGLAEESMVLDGDCGGFFSSTSVYRVRTLDEAEYVNDEPFAGRCSGLFHRALVDSASR